MRFVALALFMCAACAPSPSAVARQWNETQIADLELAAREAAEAHGLPEAQEAQDRLAEAEDLYRADAAYAGELDAAADALFAHLADQHARGGVDPALLDVGWHIARPPPPNVGALKQAVDEGHSPRALLQLLLPRSDEYRRLSDELRRLNAQPEEARDRAHIDQLRANLERWRWLPRSLPERRIEVRIAEYALAFHETGAAPLRHDVIVGAPRTPSPVFAATVESVTLNPNWDPPNSIAYNELLPRFRRDPGAAAREGFVGIDSAGAIVSAADIDWGARPFPYRLRQLPGPGNALGQVRLDLPNPFAVFLHDTPSRRLFERENRALSHGCIRVQNPAALAASVLDAPEWDEAALQAAIDRRALQTIPLATPTLIYVLYFTTAVEADGSVRYLDDIYRRDAALVAALAAPTRIAASAGRTEPCAP